MKLMTKQEWFKLDKPIGEPGIAEKYKEENYWIERVLKKSGEIVWFGLGTNWTSQDGGKSWKRLATDHSVQPLEEGGCDYPKERTIWVDCEPPIYEKKYIELNQGK